MRQIAFLIILLLAFSKGESVPTFRASDLDVWHIAFSHEVELRIPLSLLFGARAIIVIRF
jgi:hypothetical protein